MANGKRFETCAISGDPGSGQIMLNPCRSFTGGDCVWRVQNSSPKRIARPYASRVLRSIMQHACMKSTVAMAAMSRNLFISADRASADRLFRPGDLQVETTPA